MSTHQRKQLFVIANIIGYIGMLVANGLANALPINGKTTGELADAYPNLFVPSGITFAIWGVIYLLLAFYLIYSLFAVFQREIASSLFIVKTGWWFFFTCLLNTGWILVWHYELVWLSLVIMFLLLVSLILLYKRLDIGGCCAKWHEKVFVFLPFSLYLGWISIATIANATAFLVDIGWDRFGLNEAFWAVATVTAGTGLALYILFRHRDVVYALAVSWAFAGIVMKRIQATEEGDDTVLYVAAAGLVCLLICMVIQLFRGKVYR